MFTTSLRKNPLAYQVWIFAVTFLLYAAVHAVRKTFGTNANQVIDLGYTKVFVSYMNAAFMLSYALGMMFTGALGDRFRPTLVLLIACCSSAAIASAFGLMSPSLTSEGMWYLYVTFWVLNGLSQSCVWPTEVKLMSNWFGGGHSGSIYGIWSANGSVGNILGIGFSSMCAAIWGKGASGVTWSFVIPALFLVLMAVLTFLSPDTRAKAGLPDAEEQPVAAAADEETATPAAPNSQEKISFWAAWMLPGVIRYGLCYACIKAVNYVIFYWLTPFLENEGHSSNVSYTITVLNDVGWIFGGLVCGFGSDRMGTRAPFVGLFILLSVVPTALIIPCVKNVAALAVMVTLNGFLAGGAGNVVSSAVCADIGKNEKVKGSADVTGQVAGIVDGIGALGAAATQLAIGYIPNSSWGGVFYGLTGMLLFAFLLIIDLVYRDTKEWLAQRRAAARRKSEEKIVSTPTVDETHNIDLQVVRE